MEQLFRGHFIALSIENGELIFQPGNQRFTIPAARIQTATVESEAGADRPSAARPSAARIELFGFWNGERNLVRVRLPQDDARGIVEVLWKVLALPREPRQVAPAEIDSSEDDAYIEIDGRVFPYADYPVMEQRIRLNGVTVKIEHNAPYRVTGFFKRVNGEPQIDVMVTEHLNPPNQWFAGDSTRVIYLPEREFVVIAPQRGLAFTQPGGVSEVALPPAAMVSVTYDAGTLTFVGDFSRTSHPSMVMVGPLNASDGHAIVALLSERFQLPRRLYVITPADARRLTSVEYVQIDGQYRPGHFESADFEGDIKLGGVDRAYKQQLQPGARYRVTGLLSPPFEPQGPHLGWTGAWLTVLSIELIGR